MLVYDGLKYEFLNSVVSGNIASEIDKRINTTLGRRTGGSEFNSWHNSMSFMYMVLNDPCIPDNAGIAIEYNIPQTSKRVDFIVSGYDENDRENAVIIELKQWSKINKAVGYDALVETYIGGGIRTVVHPSYQAWSYAQMINDYNKSVQDKNIRLSPCTYLHNYQLVDNDPLLSDIYQTYIEEAPVFTSTDTLKLRAFIEKFVNRGDDKKILYEIDNGKIRPSKSLQDRIESMLKGNREFIMIDEQKVAFEKILKLAERGSIDGKKRTLIVEGGPGTGKSVIAVNLLSELTRRGQVAQYASKNSAPRKVYSEKLKGGLKKSSIDNLFKGAGAYVGVERNAIHTILVDEAHRLNEKSGIFKNLGENQIKEIINAGITSVFFIDESQRVTLDDIGSKEEIEKWAKRENSELCYLKLSSQFRCNGSDGYLSLVDDVLEINESKNYLLDEIDYDIQVFDNPNEIRERIKYLNSINHKSRMLAGYCWDWPTKSKNDINVPDVIIGDFAMSWNLENKTFANDDSTIDEIGCIHTSQGLEFDYVGLIIGDDMRYENEKVITDFTKRAKTDQSIKGIKSLYSKDPDSAKKKAEEIIKNTYRTLMTRGMKGCYIYATDSALREHLRECLNKAKIIRHNGSYQ